MAAGLLRAAAHVPGEGTGDRRSNRDVASCLYFHVYHFSRRLPIRPCIHGFYVQTTARRAPVTRCVRGRGRGAAAVRKPLDWTATCLSVPVRTCETQALRAVFLLL